MKIIKLICFSILIYFCFVLFVFLSINSPLDETSPSLPSDEKYAVKLIIFHLWPDFKYQFDIYLDKENRGNFIIEDKNRNLIYQNNNQSSGLLPIRFYEISKQKEVVFYLYEIPTKPIEEVIYNPEKSGDSKSYLDIEELGLIKNPPKPTSIKKIIARPVKNMETLLVVNKIILTSYKSYLLKDFKFKIIYILLLFFLIWLILRIRKEIQS